MDQAFDRSEGEKESSEENPRKDAEGGSLPEASKEGRGEGSSANAGDDQSAAKEDAAGEAVLDAENKTPEGEEEWTFLSPLPKMLQRPVSANARERKRCRLEVYTETAPSVGWWRFSAFRFRTKSPSSNSDLFGPFNRDARASQVRRPQTNPLDFKRRRRVSLPLFSVSQLRLAEGGAAWVSRLQGQADVCILSFPSAGRLLLSSNSEAALASSEESTAPSLSEASDCSLAPLLKARAAVAVESLK